MASHYKQNRTYLKIKEGISMHWLEINDQIKQKQLSSDLKNTSAESAVCNKIDVDCLPQSVQVCRLICLPLTNEH